MRVDHIVIQTLQRDALVADVAARSGLAPQTGFRQGGAVVSRGVRFANGPFFDVFSPDEGRTVRAPLVGLEGSIGDVETAARRKGWQTVIHSREAAPADIRPPWSTLSFRRGQGLISSLFIIAYEDDPDCWLSPDYSGALYARGARGEQTEKRATLTRVVLQSSDLSAARAQLDALSRDPIALLDLAPGDDATSGFGWAEISATAPGANPFEWRQSR